MAWDEVARTVDRVELIRGKRTARREYVARWNRNDGPVTSLQGLTASDGTTTVDLYNGGYPGFPGCLVNRVSIDHLSPFDLKIEIDFEDPDLIAFDQPENLLALAAVITEEDASVEEEYTIDADEPADPLLNSAGEPFDRGPTRLTSYSRFNIQKYVSAATRNAIRAAKNTCNASPKLIDGSSFGKRELLLSNTRFAKVSGTAIYQANFSIMQNDRLWINSPLDVGFKERGDNGKLKKIKVVDDNGVLVEPDKPWPLDFDGKAKATNFPADFETKSFYPYPLDPWTGVPLS